MGGGILTIPVLVLIFGVNQHTAAGTSLLVMIPNTVVGSYMHLRQRTASLRLGSIMGIGAFLGAAIGIWIGIWIAFRMNDQFLQLIFGCFVLVVATRERCVKDMASFSDFARSLERQRSRTVNRRSRGEHFEVSRRATSRRETVAFWQAGPPERSQHVPFSCLGNRLRAAIDAQLVENLSDMPFDRRSCYNQPLCDLLIR